MSAPFVFGHWICGEVRGKQEWPGGANPTHDGVFTLLSDAVIRAGGFGAGVIATINGRITGSGKLSSIALSQYNPGSGNAIRLGAIAVAIHGFNRME